MTDSAAPVFPLLFTDLDGSLLDHHSYEFEPARPLLAALKLAGIPVIPCTSKTRAEVERLRVQAGLCDPYVVENGAAIILPQGVFDSIPPNCIERYGNPCLEFALPRSHWLDLLGEMHPDFGDQFVSFHQAGIEGIMDLTGLDRASAERANQRDYSEPVFWRGSDDQKIQFITRLQQQGAKVLQGGRFLGVGGDCDKGRALNHVQALYQSLYPQKRVISLAIGDSNNDVAMLETADAALIVRSPVHMPPQLQRSDGYVTTETGPTGWCEGVLRWLHLLDIQINH